MHACLFPFPGHIVNLGRINVVSLSELQQLRSQSHPSRAQASLLDLDNEDSSDGRLCVCVCVCVCVCTNTLVSHLALSIGRDSVEALIWWAVQSISTGLLSHMWTYLPSLQDHILRYT